MKDMFENHRTDNLPDAALPGTASSAGERLIGDTSLRLRHVTLPGTLHPSERSSVLWGLAHRGMAWSRHVRLTHLLRRGAPLESDIRVFTRRFAGSETANSAIPALRRQDLQIIAAVAAKSMIPVRPDLAMLNSSTGTVPMPGICTTTLIAWNDRIKPLESGEPASGVILPFSDALAFDIDQAFAVLADAGIDADISFDINIRPFDAPTIRAISEAGKKLQSAMLCGADERRIQPVLNRLDNWHGVETVRQLHIGLRTDRVLAPDFMRLLSGLMFGVETVAGKARADISGCLHSTARPPRLFPSFGTALSVGNSAHRQRRHSDPEASRLGLDEAGRGIVIGQEDLRQHLYVTGGTGTGKTTLLRHLVSQDIRAGRGVFVIDPHGDLYTDILSAEQRLEPGRFVLADAGDIANPFSLNILETSGPHPAVQRNFIANQLIQLFKSIYSGIPEAFGPVFENWFRASLFLLMEGGGASASLADLERVFGDTGYRQRLLAKCKDRQVHSFWHNIANKAGGDLSIENVAPYITAKLAQIAGNPLVRPILCRPHTTLDIPQALERGQVVLINLAKGVIGGPDAAILGGVLTIRLFAAALARAGLPYDARRPVRVVLDEFPTYAGPVLAEMLAEARKFGLSLILANQSLDQIDNRGADLAHAVQTNCGNLAAFRAGPSDAKRMAQWLGRNTSADILQSLPNFRFAARLLDSGTPMPTRFSDIAKPGDS